MCAQRPEVAFRFYADLNDFLPVDQRQRAIEHVLPGVASVKDRIESLGVPHTEVALILVDGRSVGFDYSVQAGDRIAVYPVFHVLPTDSLLQLRPPYPGLARFVLDTHLGKLTNFLRMLGFDTLYRNDYNDAEIASIAGGQTRIVLTRDLGLLKRKEVTYGYFVRSQEPEAQVVEVLRRFQLFDAIEPFHRCLSCNGPVVPVRKEEVLDRLEPKTQRYYDEFFRCRACAQIYWKGSHFEHMQSFIGKLRRTEV